MDVATNELLCHLDSHPCDLRQEAAVRILTRLRDEDPPTLSPAYIRRAARNAEIDDARLRHRRRTLLETHANVLEWGMHPRDPETRTHARRVGRIITEELAGLPANRREALVLFISGHGISDVAEQLGLDRKRVENWIYRSLVALRRRLEARGFTRETVLHP